MAIKLYRGNHPSTREMGYEPRDGVISRYNGIEIPTRRVRDKKTRGFGDLDPPNTRLAELVAGKKPTFAEWDNEELMYGVPKCDDGKFSVKAAWQAYAVVPRRFRTAMRRELVRRAQEKMDAAQMAAVDAIIEMATSPGVDDQVRMQAAKWLIERRQGKTPDEVIHNQAKPFEVVFSHIARGPRPPREERLPAISDGNIEDAEIIDD